MTPRYEVYWTNEDGESWSRLFSNKVRMIKLVMFLTFECGARSVRWKETGLHRDQGIQKGRIDVPQNIGKIGVLEND